MSVQPVTVYLSLGSNVGNREENLKKAVAMLAERMRVGKVSSIYDTDPLGVANHPRFLNLVCEVTTTLPPAALLAAAKGIEMRMGRAPAQPGTPLPRPIDIDILFYGDQVVKTPDLVIPHPRLSERAFVLVPLSEIAPDFIHPVSKKKVWELLKKVSGKAGVIRVGSS
ncbi:MAG: 2-amino-4-hydroxy-6-hydroxymethyldihydropteridine diphosphokinase [Chloroflexota bacterium]